MYKNVAVTGAVSVVFGILISLPDPLALSTPLNKPHNASRLPKPSAYNPKSGILRDLKINRSRTFSSSSY